MAQAVPVRVRASAPIDETRRLRAPFLSSVPSPGGATRVRGVYPSLEQEPSSTYPVEIPSTRARRRVCAPLWIETWSARVDQRFPGSRCFVHFRVRLRHRSAPHPLTGGTRPRKSVKYQPLRRRWRPFGGMPLPELWCLIFGALTRLGSLLPQRIIFFTWRARTGES